MTDRIVSNQSSPTVQFVLESDAVAEASYGANGRWKISSYLRAVNTGTSASAYNGAGTQDGRVNGAVFRTHSGNPFLPGGVGAGATRWREGPYVNYVNANTNGYWSGSSTSIGVDMGLAYGSINTRPGGSVPLPRIARAPGAPGGPTFSSITPTTVKLSWSAAARGNANITNYAWQIGTSSSFSTIKDSGSAGTALTANGDGLLPGTTYYARVRATSGDGTGSYSAVTSFTTLPATPPSIAVTPSLDGKSASLVLTPPSGTSGVTKYTYERRIAGTTTPVTSTDTTSTTPTVTGLTPGVSYEWRASAWFGTYQSPFSAWVLKGQPNPNTSPGSYFDGNSADTADVDFAWTSTVNNSTSTASGHRATGWMPFVDAALGSGGSGAQQRITGAIGSYPDGSLTGTFATRYTFFTDAATAGFIAGTSKTPGSAASVSSGGMYFGQITGRVSRDQRVAGVVVFLNPAGVETSRAVGAPFTALAGVPFLATASAVAAADGLAVVGFIDVNDGDPAWSTYKGGDEVVADAAMLTVGQQFPYFDGSAPDSPQFQYDWTAAVNASPSTRTTLDVVTTDPLADPDCPPVPLPPRPPLIDDECIIEVGVWRRYWVVVPASEIARWITMLPSVVLVTGRGAATDQPPDGVRQVRIRYYANPDDLSPQDFQDTATWISEQIVSYIPPYSIMTLDAVSQRVWVQVGDSVTDPETVAARPGDHLLYGTGGGPATWPALSCGYGYLISLDVPLGADLGNLSPAIALTERML
jgi:hypothetical protein